MNLVFVMFLGNLAVSAALSNPDRKFELVSDSKNTLTSVYNFKSAGFVQLANLILNKGRYKKI